MKPKAKVNKLFPLKPNYKGPTRGMFLYVHHEVPAEFSDNILERVKYVKYDKPDEEQETRANALRYVRPSDLPKRVQGLFKKVLQFSIYKNATEADSYYRALTKFSKEFSDADELKLARKLLGDSVEMGFKGELLFPMGVDVYNRPV